jgi:quinoprotein glucose dehydrogenase
MATVLRVLIIILAAGTCACVLAPAHAQEPTASDWGYWGGDASGERYSPLSEINRDNVARLRIAWTYRTGELGAGLLHPERLAFAATPVLAFGTLYLSTPTNILIAVDADTGRERWRFDPRIDRSRDYPQLTSRGVAVWSDTDAEHGAPCRRRVFAGTLDGRLLAVDADTGRACTEFGVQGSVPLGAPVTSPPSLYRDIVIVGSAPAGPQARIIERGVIRAFDARTGAARWSFEPLPATVLASGGALASGAMSIDADRGVVFAATGGASPPAFGGGRPGTNRLANSLLAIDATTGRLLWDRQLIHHDLWNFDLAAQPTLVELELEGMSSSAVIEATRTGMLFVFDRETGVPVIPFAERPVPESRVAGERAAATQPFSALPALVPLGPVAVKDAWGLSFWDRGKCRDRIGEIRNDGIFTPPDRRGSLLYPGVLGGVDWGGIAFDPVRQRVIAAVNQVPFVVTLLERAEWERELAQQRAGRDYERAEFSWQAGSSFGLRREPFLSPFGVPCIAPPWGTLADVDLKTRQIVWQVPLGSTAGYAPWWMPVRTFGLPHVGGPVITGGNLVFIGAAADGYLRAFDVETGRELWRHRLPAGGQATPMTYRAGPRMRQLVVIAAGGNGVLGTPRGDWLEAFALPETAAAAPTLKRPAESASIPP